MVITDRLPRGSASRVIANWSLQRVVVVVGGLAEALQQQKEAPAKGWMAEMAARVSSYRRSGRDWIPSASERLVPGRRGREGLDGCSDVAKRERGRRQRPG